MGASDAIKLTHERTDKVNPNDPEERTRLSSCIVGLIGNLPPRTPLFWTERNVSEKSRCHAMSSAMRPLPLMDQVRGPKFFEGRLYHVRSILLGVPVQER